MKLFSAITILAAFFLMNLVLSFAMSGSAIADAEPEDQSAKIESISEVLDAFHNAAARADWTTYFDLMSDDAVFIGTDVSERWMCHRERLLSAFRTFRTTFLGILFRHAIANRID